MKIIAALLRRIADRIDPPKRSKLQAGEYFTDKLCDLKWEPALDMSEGYLFRNSRG